MKKNLKLLSIVGARPQFIKLKPLAEQLKRRRIKHTIVHTGQHYDYEMSKIFFQELSIPKPHYNLGVGSASAPLQIADMLKKTAAVLAKERPDAVIVYGDTNSTLAGALAASTLNIPLAHIEAGLRSWRRDMPEEINRTLTDHLSDMLFCPTKTALANLKKEGIAEKAYLSGDIMYEALQKIKPKIKTSKILNKLNLKTKQYLLLTIHRKSNTDNLSRLKSILTALRKSKRAIVFPVHPRTAKALKKIKNFSKEKYGSFLFTQPVSYLDMLALELSAEKIITDSGGVQKEAYWLKIPCITLREETEWPETLKNKANILAGADPHKIAQALGKKPLSFRPIFPIKFPSEKIAEKITAFLTSQNR